MSPEEEKTLGAPFRLMPVWFMGSSVAGVAAWIWGSSEWPTRLFKFTFGVSSFLLVLVCLLILLFLLGRITWQKAHFARNDFSNFGPWALGRLQRGVSSLLGMMLVTFIAWISVGSQGGAKLTLLCGIFAGGLQWCAYGMHVMLKAQQSVR